MAVTETSICNSALIKLGVAPIAALTEDSKAGRLCNEQYAKLRNEVLTDHPWNFASARVELGLLDDTPSFGYDYQFQLPTDCLRVLPDPEYDDIEYKIEGRYLLTDEDTFSVKYIKEITDTSLFAPIFCEALSCRIAADLCFALTGSSERASEMMKAYQFQLRKARSIDAQEGTPPDVVSDQWTSARR